MESDDIRSTDLLDGSLRVLCGDVRETLKTIPAESVNCCVTSPPYWMMRCYDNDRQIGLEETMPEYIAALVGVMREVRRVLTNDGTAWLNIGDSYARSGGWSDNSGLDGKARGESGRAVSNIGRGKTGQKCPDGLKQKDLCMMPARAALALQEDGWWIRNDIIWRKTNPMPDSATDRCAKTHEHLWLLTKSETYHFCMNETGKLGDVWETPCSNYNGAHFATFPPELITRCVLAGCPVGGVVLDPFAGSGTTGMVALELGRRALLCELNPEYVKLINQRTNVTQGFALPSNKDIRPHENP